MNTVNVILILNGVVLTCHSYGSSGNDMLEAEEQFRKLAKGMGCHDKTISEAIAGGYYIQVGAYSINLVSNCNKEEKDKGWQEDDECPNCHCGTLGLENGHLVCRGECGQFIEKDFQETMNGLLKQCKKCGSKLLDNGLCPDVTCPYSDRQQNETYTEG